MYTLNNIMYTNCTVMGYRMMNLPIMCKRTWALLDSKELMTITMEEWETHRAEHRHVVARGMEH